jgi:hypothetical protein
MSKLGELEYDLKNYVNFTSVFKNIKTILDKAFLLLRLKNKILFKKILDKQLNTSLK